jgi:hypothetical protein
MKRTLIGLLAALTTGLVMPPEAARGQTPVELELVLAVDASSSVTGWEFNLQMMGLAGAFRDPAVQGAVRAAGDNGIAVALVQWSGRDRQILAVDWTAIRDASGAEEFAAEIDATPRFITGGSTAIGNAIKFSTELIEYNRFDGRRRVIDVSGDGRTNQGVQTKKYRDNAVSKAITVNGLTILNEDPSVDAYYRSAVIGGNGAFLVTATDYKDFARSIRLKLIREIGGPPLVKGPQPGLAAPSALQRASRVAPASPPSGRPAGAGPR